MDIGQSRSRFRGVNMIPDQYDGSEPWEEYLSQFNDYAELGQWDLRSKLLMLSASLRGPARRFYLSLDHSERRSYYTLLPMMNKRFGSSSHPFKWLSQLECRQRNADESMAALCDDLRQLSKKSFPELNCQAQDAIALNHLYKIIPLEMKVRCIDNNCQSVWDAAAVVNKYEAILGYHDQHSSCDDTVQNTSHIDPTVCQILEKLVSRIENIERVAESAESLNPGLNKRRKCCFRCNSSRHLIMHCPERRHYSGRYGFKRHNNSSSKNWRQRSQPVEKRFVSGSPVSCELQERPKPDDTSSENEEPEFIETDSTDDTASEKTMLCRVISLGPSKVRTSSSKCKADECTDSTDHKKCVLNIPAIRQSARRNKRNHKKYTLNIPAIRQSARRNTRNHKKYTLNITAIRQSARRTSRNSDWSFPGRSSKSTAGRDAPKSTSIGVPVWKTVIDSLEHSACDVFVRYYSAITANGHGDCNNCRGSDC